MKALITGGTGGIGSALVRAFSQYYDVVFTYKSSEEKALDLQKEFFCNGVRCDISDEKNVCQCACDLLKSYNYFDVIVNNAGISDIKMFSDITPFEWKRMIDINLNGAYNVTSAFLPPMISRKCGNIINISSMWGIYGASCEVHYSTAKAGLIGFTKALAKELAPSGILVNAIAPGVINTSMNKQLCEEEMNELKDKIPLGFLGNGDDVANTALFLSQAKYITGQIISVDGGFIG